MTNLTEPWIQNEIKVVQKLRLVEAILDTVPKMSSDVCKPFSVHLLEDSKLLFFKVRFLFLFSDLLLLFSTLLLTGNIESIRNGLLQEAHCLDVCVPFRYAERL